MSDPTLPSLPAKRARRFLQELADEPFIALVFNADDVRVYSKGLDDETMNKVARLLEAINNPESEETERN